MRGIRRPLRRLTGFPASKIAGYRLQGSDCGQSGGFGAKYSRAQADRLEAG